MVKPYSYNASFSYPYGSFDVNMTRFSYSWSLRGTGDSQARQAYIFYPRRREQSPLTVELVFRTPDEYRAFADFVDQYNTYATQGANARYLTFSSSAIRTNPLSPAQGGVRYGVVLPSVKFDFGIDMTAPKMNLSMMILKDMIDPWEEDASTVTGDATDLVTSNDVGDLGDAAYITPPERELDRADRQRTGH